MTYDLRRLRPNGLIRRIEHANRYVLTPDGIRVATFHAELYNRLLVPPGIPVCITVTLLDGLVLARAAFHRSL